MGISNVYKPAVKLFFIVMSSCIIVSCTQKSPKHTTTEKRDTIKPPVIVNALLPVIINADTRPAPEVVAIPVKAGGFRLAQTDPVLKRVQLVPPKKASPFLTESMQNYNTEHGLAYGIVVCSYRDRNGNLWFGTYGGGVSRYDGKSFTNFSSNQGLLSDIVCRIIEDENGNLWFATLGGGVSRYDGRVFENFTTDQGLANNNVYNILEDKKDNLWFSTDGGASRLDHDKKNLPVAQIAFTNYTSADGLASNNISSIAEDKNDALWFATSDSGVSMYDGKSFVNFTTKQGLPGNSIYKVFAAKNGDLWFATIDAGISRYDGKLFVNFNTEQGLVDNGVENIFEDKNGNLWFSTRGVGVSRLDNWAKILPPERVRFSNYTTTQGLAGNNIWDIAEDRSGNLWFCTFGNGISRSDGSIVSLKYYGKDNGQVDYLVHSVMEDRQGNLWIGMDGGGISEFDSTKRNETTYSIEQGLVNNHVSSILEDKEDNIWFGTNAGISQLNPRKKIFTNFNISQGLINNRVNCILEDKKRNTWFGTDSGVSKLNSDKKSFSNYSTAQGLLGNAVYSIFEDKNGNLWFATWGAGVSRLDSSHKFFTSWTSDQGLAGNVVLSIFEEKNGIIWFGTGNGLSRYDGKSFINYRMTEGLGDNAVLSLLMDDEGVIWMGTNNGFTGLSGFVKKTKQLSDTSQKELLPASNDHSNADLQNGGFVPVFEVYNNKTGYAVKDFFFNSICLSRDGSIWGGTSEKLLRFTHNNHTKNTDPAKVFIQSIKVNDEAIYWQDLLDHSIENDSSANTSVATGEINLAGKIIGRAERDTMIKKFSGIKFDSISRFYPVPVNLVLPYRHNDITFDYAAIEPARPGLVRYTYILEGYDDEWNPPTNETSAGFGNIHEGNYTFKLKAQSPDGIWSEPLIYTFKVLPPWYRMWWAYSLYVLLFLTALLGFIKWRERTLKKEKRVLEEKITMRTHELKEEKEKVESTLTELKSTQTQLIQSAKMASLGELTAGIAHEIQNPLNFVNNFSEVNKELLIELKDEMNKGNIDDANAIANDVIENSEKINHHGKRADSIVKGMLQHSRSSTGIKEPTDINALADEYLRLAYHGLRGKDNSFNVTMKTDFDESISKINIIPQDIGRVLLNLYNNAFYAVKEKSKQQPEGYQPTVLVSTKNEGDKILIFVKDNGNGIPQKIVDKIFHPFFTTKPTGQGTGLGLSLAYDIVKTYGSELKVVTKEGEGCEFIIMLPL